MGGIRESIARDLLVLRRVAACAEWMFPTHYKGLELSSSLQEWATALWSELDYQQEARDQERFRSEMLAAVKGVNVPRVCWDVTAGRVLTTEWLDGIRLADAPICGLAGRFTCSCVSAPPS